MYMNDVCNLFHHSNMQISSDFLAPVSKSSTPVSAIPDQSSPGKSLSSQAQSDGVSQSTDSRPRSFSTGASTHSGFVPSVHGHKWKKTHMHVSTCTCSVRI